MPRKSETGLSFTSQQFWSWFDGEFHILHEGVDYPAGHAWEDVRKRLRQAAWRRGVRLKLTYLGNKIMLKSSEDAWSNRDSLSQGRAAPVVTSQDKEIEELRAEVVRLAAIAASYESLATEAVQALREYQKRHPPR